MENIARYFDVSDLVDYITDSYMGAKLLKFFKLK